jgi:hypothetical protein
MLKARANVNIIVAQPPTYDNWDNYLVPSLQAVYDFSASKSRIKAVLLCNPHNPLARCYPKKALLEVMEFCQEHGLHLIVDEIYALTNLNDVDDRAPKFVSALSLTEPLVPEGAVKVNPSRVHVVWSASKLFGMSGFRVVSYSLTSLPHKSDTKYPGLRRVPAKPPLTVCHLPPHNISRHNHIITLPNLPPHIPAPLHPSQAQFRAPNDVVPLTRRRTTQVEYRLRHAHARPLPVREAGKAREERG